MTSSRPIRVIATEDERLVNKPTTLLECERTNHPWQEIRNANGVKELVQHNWDTIKGKRVITEVAELKRCSRCGTRRQSIFSYPGFDFLGYIYDEKPEGATPVHIDGAPRLTKPDKHRAYFLRMASSYQLVADSTA